MKSTSNRSTWKISRIFAIVAVVAMLMVALPAAVSGQGLDPSSVEVTLEPGESVEITKTVSTPTIPPLADICFLADSTGSMGPAIANVQANAQNIMDAVQAEAPNAQFCVAEYKDLGDAFAYRLNQAVTGDETLVQTGIAAWVASGGGDTPEAQLIALNEMANPSNALNDPGFRAGSTRIIVWFGDAPGHEAPEAGYPSRAEVIANLTTDGSNAPIIVIALSVGLNQLNTTGQASEIAAATGGIFREGVNDADVADAILDALQAINVEVAMVSDCADPISTSFDPASQTVTSGEDAVFTETITVDPAAAPGTYECDDWATINGEPMTDDSGAVITEHKTITVPSVDQKVDQEVEVDQANDATQVNGTKQKCEAEAEQEENTNISVFGDATQTNTNTAECANVNLTDQEIEQENEVESGS